MRPGRPGRALESVQLTLDGFLVSRHLVESVLQRRHTLVESVHALLSGLRRLVLNRGELRLERGDVVLRRRVSLELEHENERDSGGGDTENGDGTNQVGADAQLAIELGEPGP